MAVIVIVLLGIFYLKPTQQGQEGTQQISEHETSSSTESESSVEKPVEPIDNAFLYDQLALKESKETLSHPEGQVTLRSVGDVLIHETVSEFADTSSTVYQQALTDMEAEGFSAETFHPEAAYDFSPMLAYIAPYMSYADISVANLEVLAASPQLAVSGYPSFSAPKEIIPALQGIGIDIVSNATNHTLDYLSRGAHYSLDNLQEAGMMSYGSYASFEDKAQARIIEKNGLSIGFLSYTYGTNGIPTPEGEDYLVSRLDLPVMVEEVESLQQQVDAVVVSMHMGPEYGEVPTEEQQYVFQTLADTGVKVILGGHPHVLQPVDWFNDGDTYAIYSQASFMSGQIDAENKQGGITEVTLEKGDDGQVTVKDPKFMPLYICGNNENKEMFYTVPYADRKKYNIPEGEVWWDTLAKRMESLTNDVTVVTHLETEASKEAHDVFR